MKDDDDIIQTMKEEQWDLFPVLWALLIFIILVLGSLSERWEKKNETRGDVQCEKCNK